MARRRRKKNSLQTNIKYEVYGILIIIFSIITLAGRNGEIPGIGPVGRSLSDLCSFLVGELYFIIPLIFIYVGLFLMVKRKWPRSWSYKKTGFLLAIIAMLITYHIGLIRNLDPTGEFTAWMIMKEPIDNFSTMFTDDVGTTVLQNGGGLIGAFCYGILFFLFGNLGSSFVVVALFAIAFVCLTGWSYVDMITKLKRYLGSTWTTINTRLQEKLKRSKGKRKNPKTIQHTSIKVPIDDDMDEEYDHTEKDKKAPSFFQLFQSKPILLEAPQNTSDNENKVTEIPLFRNFQEEQLVQQEDSTKEVLNKEVRRDDTAQALSNEDRDKAMMQDKPSTSVPYQLPPFRLLDKPSSQNRGVGAVDYKTNARKLEATLESFGVRAKVLEVVRGPSVTRYEIQPDIGVKVSRIVSLTDDIALALAAKDIRMEAPIPGKSAIGIEVPNTEVSIVTMKEVMESSAFHEADSKLSIVLGRDISGQPIVGNLAKMPHLLVAGATGSGKSVCVNGIITSILYKAKPNEVKFLMIDPKKVELNVYNGIPHLLAPVVTDPRRASLALKKVVSEMEKRYELFSNSGARNIEGYNEILAETKETEALPYIVVIVDELADLMMVAAKDVEDAICRLAQMARAAGIHLIIATQRPSVDVITGLIKANIPSRIAFGVSSQVDSRTILDTVGAEKLLGRGDMLFLPVGASKSIRVQGAFLSDQEVEAVVNFVKNQEKADYQEEMVPEIEDQTDSVDDVEDELFDQAVQIILEAKQASVSLLQRRMRIGYTRAARLIDSMEAKGIVGPYEGSKPREVLTTMEQYHQNRMSS